VTGIAFNAILVNSSDKGIQPFTKVGVQPGSGVVRPEGVELAAIESETDRTSSRDNLNSSTITKSTTTS